MDALMVKKPMVEDTRDASIHLDEARMTQLMQAARQGHVDTVRSLLCDASPNIKDHTGRTVLSWAASYGLIRNPCDRYIVERIFDFLLGQGAQIDTGDNTGERPIHWAAKAGDKETVDLLLQKGAHSDLPDIRGRTPLSRAAERGYHGVVERLLADGRVDLDSRDGRGRTPLSWAAENWQWETVEALVRYGADVEIHDYEGQIPLWWFLNNTERRNAASLNPTAQRGAFQQWLAILWSKKRVEPMTKKRRTFLAWASERGDRQLVRELLQTAWADPNSIDRHRKTPLIYALEWKHYEVADMLIFGAGHTGKQKKDLVSLHLLIREQGRSRLLKLFLERYKPDLEEEDKYSSITLMKMALQQSDRATVRLLLEYKASIHGLENSDWFGPCSTVKAPTNLVFLNNAPTNQDGFSSIPLMKMAIKEHDRAAVAALMDRRAQMMELEEDEDDFVQYSRDMPSSVAVDIVAFEDGRQTVQWLSEETFPSRISDASKSPEGTHLV
jgi:ankyrin repeat protein